MTDSTRNEVKGRPRINNYVLNPGIAAFNLDVKRVGAMGLPLDRARKVGKIKGQGRRLG